MQDIRLVWSVILFGRRRYFGKETFQRNEKERNPEIDYISKENEE